MCPTDFKQVKNVRVVSYCPEKVKAWNQ
uniref:Uncharacterized protein n=1 Tax=Arundo donax TaxID=35708 RepID=A0A0A8Y5D1_ARUDO